MVESILGVILAVAVAVERLTEIIKPLYLSVKNFFTKKNETDLTKDEKVIMSIVVSVALSVTAVLLGVKEVSPLGGINPFIQAIMIGLFASFGSNIIHPIMELVIAFKDAAEGLKKPTTFTPDYVTVGPDKAVPNGTVQKTE